MKKDMRQVLSTAISPELGVVFLVSAFAANTDKERSSIVIWAQRFALASRSVSRLSGGLVALAACGHARNLPYGEGMWRKHMMALSLDEGIVGGARDILRAFSQHPSRRSKFGSFAMMRLAQDLRDENLALPD